MTSHCWVNIPQTTQWLLRYSIGGQRNKQLMLLWQNRCLRCLFSPFGIRVNNTMTHKQIHTRPSHLLDRFQWKSQRHRSKYLWISWLIIKRNGCRGQTEERVFSLQLLLFAESLPLQDLMPRHQCHPETGAVMTDAKQ